MTIAIEGRQSLAPLTLAIALGITLLLSVGVAGCGSAVSPGGAASESAGGAGVGGGSAGSGGIGGVGSAGSGGGGGAGSCDPVIGKSIQCSADLAACCKAQGGTPGDICVGNNGCTSGQWAMCYPPLPAPANDEFACDYFNCKVGQVCMSPYAAFDGCWLHACKTAPDPCDGKPTCACLSANKLLDSSTPGPGVTCTEDAAGNVRIEGNVQW